MARLKKKFSICKTIGVYEKDGVEKKDYKRIGDMLQFSHDDKEDTFMVELDFLIFVIVILVVGVVVVAIYLILRRRRI